MSKELTCLHCREKFYLYEDLMWHINYEHQYGDPFYCVIPECDAMFSWGDLDAYEKHTTEVHPGDKLQIGYTCTVCGERFATEELEKIHYVDMHS